ncbi:hypothetical protein [Pelosinus sp. UFO1]|uniref:gp53-like domain-containing protein n=1 Tax=Pelosinus sp. UFO1 TaxID=484770 RepID=UPI0004D1E296|nr:hypothetical protein [Pelosinus sp. UFO1]AIF51273.1 hypothetical protein UFO1_1722 [Pelosinus sp. UFO1]
MAYNSNLPMDNTSDIRENFRALKDDKIVAAATAITADTAVKLANARKISLDGDATGSTSFDGSADVTITVDVLTADTSAQCTGNAATATKLETARKINGVYFDGTADITITQLNGKDIATTDQIPTSLPANGGDADTVDGKHAVDFAPAGYVPPNATETTDGSMSAADKAKLDSIEAGAQVNQNAFSNVVVNGTTIHADSQADTIELVGGTNIALTADATSEKVTIAVTGKVASAAQADTATNAISAGNADTLDGHHWSEVQAAIANNNFDAGHSFNINGYQKFGSGLVMQWGSWSGATPTTVSFPIPFPRACFSVSIDNTSGGSYSLSGINITTKTFDNSYPGMLFPASWIAFGY